MSWNQNIIEGGPPFNTRRKVRGLVSTAFGSEHGLVVVFHNLGPCAYDAHFLLPSSSHSPDLNDYVLHGTQRRRWPSFSRP